MRPGKRNFKRKKINSNYHKDNSVIGKFVGILLAMLFIILLVAVAGYIFFNSGENIDTTKWGSEKLVFRVSGPEEVSSGGQVEYEIYLENQGNINLNQGELSITFPEGFQLSQNNPEFDREVNSGGIWKTEQIHPYDSLNFTVLGNLFGEVDETKVISLAFSYQPENFSSSFLETSAYETEIASSLLGVDFDVEDSVMAGQEVSSKIEIIKNGDSDLALYKLKVVLEYPEGFEIVEANYPEVSTGYGGSQAFEISNFANSATLNLTSIFLGDDNEKKSLTVRVYSVDSDGQESPEIIQLRKVVYIEQPALGLDLKVENSNESSQSLEWGQQADFEVDYSNDWDKDLSDLVLRVNFSGDNVFDWDSTRFYGDLNQDYIGEIDRGQMFLFNKLTAGDLELLTAGDSGSLRFKINIDEQAVGVDSGSVEVSVTLIAGNFEIASNSVTIEVR